MAGLVIFEVRCFLSFLNLIVVEQRTKFKSTGMAFSFGIRDAQARAILAEQTLASLHIVSRFLFHIKI